MAEESFELKSNKYVLTLILNPSVPYQKMVSDIAAKFRRSARFFRGGQMAVQFRGRELTEVQETEIVDAITQNCQLDITCIIESDPDKEEQQKEAIVRAMTSVRENSYAKEPTAALVTRSLAAGERYSSLRPVVLLGDLQPGAEIISAGSILIWGTATASFSEETAAEYGFTAIYNKADMDALTEGSRSFGQFSGNTWWESVPKDDPSPTLQQMGEKAIELLNADNENGFFLMIEGAHIDKNSHRTEEGVDFPKKITDAAWAVKGFDNMIKW